MKISTADYIGQLLLRHLAANDTGRLDRFILGPHSRRWLVLSAVAKLPTRELDVLVKFNRQDLNKAKLTVSNGWVDPAFRMAAKFFFDEKTRLLANNFLRDFHGTPTPMPLDWIVGKHLIKQYFNHNLYNWGLFQRDSTQLNLQFSTYLPGLNDAGDSDVRIAHDNMLNVVTTLPRRKNLEDAIKNEIASAMRQEGIQLFPEEESDVELPGAEAPQIQTSQKA